MFIQKYFPHIIMLEKIGFFWPMPQRKYPKVPKKLQTFYRWYRLIYRTTIPWFQYFSIFCALYVLLKTPGKTLIIYGAVITHAALVFYGTSLEFKEVEESEKSGFLGRLFLMDLDFDGKNAHQSLFVSIDTVTDYRAFFPPELLIRPNCTETTDLWALYKVPNYYIIYCYMAYLCLYFFPFLSVLVWFMRIDPIFIFLNSTLLDLETGFLMPGLVLGIYCFVAFGTVYKVVESMVTVSVSLATLCFWLTAHRFSQGEQF